MRLRIRHIAHGMVAAALLAGGAGAVGPGWRWTSLPSGFSAPPVPVDNPMSGVKVALGRRLFYDRALSSNGSLACADCHQQERGFTDGLSTHPGVSGEMGVRNVPGLANVAWRPALTWTDANLLSLEQQAMVPMTGTKPVEMGLGGQESLLAQRLDADPCYRRLFAMAFPGPEKGANVGKVTAALAAFQRTILSYSTPYDRFAAGQSGALPPLAAKGLVQFKSAGCASCHGGRDFTDSKVHYVGTAAPSEADGAAYGGKPLPPGFVPPPDSFRTPSLRNVAVTGPWLHDGRADSVESAIRRHAATQLIGVDMPALLAFMDSLTDPVLLTAPHLARPPASCPVPA
ncbi:cytochrome-c peroxidase [Sphingobium ummariense]